MSKYTTELRYIIESGYELKALKDYPIFDENYRQVLNKYILNHFSVTRSSKKKSIYHINSFRQNNPL